MLSILKRVETLSSTSLLQTVHTSNTMLRNILHIRGIVTIGVIALMMVVGPTTIYFLSSKEEGSSIVKRELRFFDPDHRTCGRDEKDPDKLAHGFAIHSLYGAGLAEIEAGYYQRRTISTLQPLPEDLEKIDKIFKVLSYVAKQTDRPIRVNKPTLFGYNSEPKQGYALVNVINLKAAGVDIVEEVYWARAVQAQKVARNVHEVSLLEGDSMALLQSIQDDVDKLEYGFDIEQLLTIDLDVIGSLVGEAGGYVNGQWTTRFNCFYEHDKPDAIRRANDKLAVLW